MKNIILFDDDVRDHLLPLTFTRPVAEIRIGILTIREKWERFLNGNASHITQEYLSEKFPIQIESENFVINGSVIPSEQLCQLVEELELNEAYLKDGELIAAKLDAAQFHHLMQDEEIKELKGYDLGDTPLLKLRRVWDIFLFNGEALKSDFELLTRRRTSAPISGTNQIRGRENIFIEEGAVVECAILNATDGPIYIGENAVVMEGAMIRGGLGLCEGAQIKLGAKIYGPTTIGPYSKVGGEINNSVILGYSNKGHDGFLGNAVLGEWCNLGADTNCSNLKNNYGEVKVWNYPAQSFVPSGQQFCGLIMGDHSKSGINAMFNTGTVVGVFANIFGGGFPPKFIPSFSWGSENGFSTYRLEEAWKVAERVMSRRKVNFSELDKGTLENIYKSTAQFRPWEEG